MRAFLACRSRPYTHIVTIMRTKGVDAVSERKSRSGPPRPTGTRERIAQLGIEVFGASWKTPLAEALGVTHGYVSQLMSGKRPVTKDIIDRLVVFAAEAAEEEQARHLMRMIVIRKFQCNPPKPAPTLIDSDG